MKDHRRPLAPKGHQNGSDTDSQRLWYGPTARVIIGPGFRHKAGFGHLLILHPPVANCLLRLGVDPAEGRRLSARHEIGHLQTIPAALLYLGTNLAVANAAGNLNWRVGLFLFVSAHAAWEILAETYVIATSRRFYRQCYQGTSKLPRLLFWTSAAVVSLAGWIVARWTSQRRVYGEQGAKLFVISE